MSFLTNKVIGQAVRAEFQNRTIITQLGVQDKDTRLVGKGAGDTIDFVNFEAISDGFQEIEVKGEAIQYEELGQNSKSATVREVARGIKFHDRDVLHSISGGSIEAEAQRQLIEVFARGLDTEAMKTLVASAGAAIDGTTGLNGKLFLDALFNNYGENALETAKAIVVHPVVATQLLGDDKNVVRADSYQTSYRGEIGKLFNSTPIIASERVERDAVDGTYKNIIVPDKSLLYVLGQDIKVESDRDIDTKWNFYNANLYFAMVALKNAVVVKGAL